MKKKTKITSLEEIKKDSKKKKKYNCCISCGDYHEVSLEGEYRCPNCGWKNNYKIK